MQSSRRAISALECPSAASSTIFARTTSRCARVYCPARRRNSTSSVSLNSIRYLLATDPKVRQPRYDSFNEPGTYYRGRPLGPAISAAAFEVATGGRACGVLGAAAVIAMAVPPAVSVSAPIAAAGCASRRSGRDSGPPRDSRLRELVTGGTVGSSHGTPAAPDAALGPSPDAASRASLASGGVLGSDAARALPSTGARSATQRSKSSSLPRQGASLAGGASPGVRCGWLAAAGRCPSPSSSCSAAPFCVAGAGWLGGSSDRSSSLRSTMSSSVVIARWSRSTSPQPPTLLRLPIASPSYLALRFPSRTRIALILAQHTAIRVSFFRSFRFFGGLVARAQSILPGRMVERGGCRRGVGDASVDGSQVGE